MSRFAFALDMTILARFGLSRSRGPKSDQVGVAAQPPSNPLVVGSLGSLCSDNLSIIKLIFLHKLLHPSFHILQVDVGYPAKLYTQIMLTSELSPTAHIASITAKGHQRANAILRCFESRELVRAFTTYVRPLLEYSSVVWSPYLKSDTEAVEKVQRKYTKRIAGFKKLSYDQRLKILDLPSLELRRLYADLLWCYKIVLGVVDVTRDDFFSVVFYIYHTRSYVQVI